MKRVLLAAVACSLLAGCNTLSDVTKNPACVTRVSLKGAYGGGVPTGTWSASAVCNQKAAAGLAGIPGPPPAEDKAP